MVPISYPLDKFVLSPLSSIAHICNQHLKFLLFIHISLLHFCLMLAQKIQFDEESKHGEEKEGNEEK